MPSDSAPIFIIGSGRSGTTLLRSILNAHPRIHLTFEASFYAVGPRFSSRRSGDEWLDRYTALPPFLFMRIDPDELRRRLPQPLPREELRLAVREIMRISAECYGKPRYGDKTPIHTRFLEQIFRDFPDARVLHIVRAPRPTVESLIRMPWAPASPALATLFYRKRVEEVAPFRDRIHELRFEDLVANPESVLRDALDYVGEPWSDRVLDHSHYAPTDDIPPLPWFQNAKRALRQDARPRKLSPAWTRIIEQETAAIRERYGYAPEPLDVEPSAAAKLGARIADLPTALATAGRMIRVGVSLARSKRPGFSQTIRAINSINPSALAQYEDPSIPSSPPAPRRLDCDERSLSTLESGPAGTP